jgi:hypothetical protein
MRYGDAVSIMDGDTVVGIVTMRHMGKTNGKARVAFTFDKALHITRRDGVSVPATMEAERTTREELVHDDETIRKRSVDEVASSAASRGVVPGRGDRLRKTHSAPIDAPRNQ